jgi:hypothetical protein
LPRTTESIEATCNEDWADAIPNEATTKAALIMDFMSVLFLTVCGTKGTRNQKIMYLGALISS